MTFLDSLNPNQRKAAEHTEGPLLVIAGAGAGKTRVLTHRIMSLMEQGVHPQKILAITFTNKAAKEMRERVLSLLKDKKKEGDNTRPPFVSTFHSLGVEILRESGDIIGVSRHFSIYDRSDSLRQIKKSLKEAGYDPKEWNPRNVLGSISKHKGAGLGIEDFENKDERGFWDEVISKAWAIYEREKKKENALDFDDLLLIPMKLLRDNEKIRDQYHKRWSHVHIDEYQDTNGVQYNLTRLLVNPKHNNICVVGDGDQTIYSWRGADVSNILDFEKDFPDATVVSLEENYRSTETILKAANEIISHNTNRKEKNLFTQQGKGEKIQILASLDENDEARDIARKADTLIKEGTPPQEIAVLYRTNAQSRVIEQAFLNAGVPYQILGTRFFDRKEVKDVLSFLRAALNPQSFFDLERVINVPPRGIGKKSLELIQKDRKEELSPTRRKKVEEFFRLLDRVNKKIESSSPREVIDFVIKESGMEENFKKDGDDGEERLQNAQELETLALKYESMEAPKGILKMLEEAALASDADSLEKDEPAVKLMTIHASKGLEFDVVIVTGLEEGLFPQERAEGTLEQAEEERRLFYVALTRARKKIILTLAEARTLFGSRSWNMPSRFIGDISEDLLEQEDLSFEIYRGNDEGFLNLDEL